MKKIKASPTWANINPKNKTGRKNTKRGERQKQNEFLTNLQSKFIRVRPYIAVDQDTPNRLTSMGWDFELSTNDECIKVECKYPQPERTNFAFPPLDLLKDSQKIAMAEVKASGGTYAILEFFKSSPPIIYIPVKGTNAWERFDAYGYLLRRFDRK